MLTVSEIDKVYLEFKNVISKNEELKLGQYKRLLKEFSGVIEKSRGEIEKAVAEQKAVVEKVIHDYRKISAKMLVKDKERIEREKTTAPSFNLLVAAGFGRNELTHSRILAWFLDWRETHSQGTLFFEIFLQKILSIEREKIPLFLKNTYHVNKEESHNDSRIDIEIIASGATPQFIIHIENKTVSSEGVRQTERETNDLLEKSDRLGISEDMVFALYLTKDGSEPSCCKIFKPITWRNIVEVLREFEIRAECELVKSFTKQYKQVVLNNLT